MPLLVPVRKVHVSNNGSYERSIFGGSSSEVRIHRRRLRPQHRNLSASRTPTTERPTDPHRRLHQLPLSDRCEARTLGAVVQSHLWEASHGKFIQPSNTTASTRPKAPPKLRTPFRSRDLQEAPWDSTAEAIRTLFRSMATLSVFSSACLVRWSSRGALVRNGRNEPTPHLKTQTWLKLVADKAC